jgi:mRNA-degrading endonuclease RelE of RelBE toxin-antitoxin system
MVPFPRDLVATFELEFTSAARRDLAAMPLEDAEAVVAALEAFAQTGKGDVKKLSGKFREGKLLRLRKGKWRAILAPDGRVLHVVRIHDRRDAYR